MKDILENWNIVPEKVEEFKGVENPFFTEKSFIVNNQFFLKAGSIKNIEMKDLLIRSITLPEKIKAAIESKLQQQQEALAYQYRLERETSEADRLRIQAQGIADYNKILSASITPNILKQKGIDATLELANSPNSKVIVVGSGDDGLPLILGGNN